MTRTFCTFIGPKIPTKNVTHTMSLFLPDLLVALLASPGDGGTASLLNSAVEGLAASIVSRSADHPLMHESMKPSAGSGTAAGGQRDLTSFRHARLAAKHCCGAGMCSYTATGPKPVQQDGAACLTCCMSYVCLACARVCHKDHYMTTAQAYAAMKFRSEHGAGAAFPPALGEAGWCRCGAGGNCSLVDTIIPVNTRSILRTPQAFLHYAHRAVKAAAGEYGGGTGLSAQRKVRERGREGGSGHCSCMGEYAYLFLW